MKNMVIVFGVICSACVNREPKQDVCSREEALEGIVPLTIAVNDPAWAGLNDPPEAALDACKMWEDIGISCSLADSVENADIYVDSFSDWDCPTGGEVAILGDLHNRKPGIWINDASPCLPAENVRGWFVHLVAHEIGHMIGVSDVPLFCGNSIMNPAIERLQPATILSAITETDLQAFSERNTRSLLLDGETVLDCGDGPNEEAPEEVPAAEEVDTDPMTATLWLEPKILPWSKAISDGCSWWAQVHLSCEFALSAREAEVIIRDLESDACGIAGFTYYDWELFGGRYVVEINLNCMPNEPSDASNWIRKVAAHELAHTQGVGHVPLFCGDAVMNPYLTNRSSISSADVSAWRERYENYLQ